MATKPVHGHQHHHAHHAHRTHQGEHAHHAHKNHNHPDKPTKGKPQTQPGQAGQPPPTTPGTAQPPPVQGSGAPTPPTAPTPAPANPPPPSDQYHPPSPPPVILQPSPGTPAPNTGTTPPPPIFQPPSGTGTAPTPPPATQGSGVPPLPAPPPTTQGQPAQGTGAPVPTPAPLPPPPVTVSNPVPWVDQLNPTGADASYTNGAMNCGPACGAMIARDIGFDANLSDAQLIDTLGQIGQTDETGTSGNGVIAMLDAMGMDTAATPGADMSWITSQLQAGHYITALGDFYQVPGRIDPSLTAGHYLDVTGYTAATASASASYQVSDPMNEALNAMTYAQLQNFITSGPGGGFAIASWPAAQVL